MTTPESKEPNQFNGIWNRETYNENVMNTANDMAENNGPAGNKPKVKEKYWGFLTVIINLIVFLLASAALLPVIVYFSNPEPGKILTQEKLTELATQPGALLASSLLMYTIWLGGMWLTTRFFGQKSWKKDFKFSFKKWDAFIGLAIATGLYLTLFLVQLVLTALGVNLEGADNGAQIANQQGIWFLIIAVGIASILGPFSEEMFFRGWMMNAIINTFKRPKQKADKLGLQKETNPITVWFATSLNKIATVTAIILSSAIFGLFHFQDASLGGIFVVLVAGTLGSVFAIVTLKTGRLGPAIFGHMFYNFATLMIATFFG